MRNYLLLNAEQHRAAYGYHSCFNRAINFANSAHRKLIHLVNLRNIYRSSLKQIFLTFLFCLLISYLGFFFQIATFFFYFYHLSLTFYLFSVSKRISLFP